MFANCETIKTSLGVDNEVLLHYIQNNSNGTIPIKYKAAEGRLLKTNGKIYDDISISLFGINDINITSQMIRFNALFTSLEKLKFEFPQQLFLRLLYLRIQDLEGYKQLIKVFLVLYKMK